MLQAVKTRAREWLRSSGYDIVRIEPDDLARYVDIFGSDAVRDRRFYNIGAGGFRHPAWTNIDRPSDWYAEMQSGILAYDLTGNEPLPIDTGTAEILYTSHTIEHVPDSAVERLFAEAYRSLKPGGIFRVTTGPDAETNFRALTRGDEDWFFMDRAYDAPGTFEQFFHAPATSVPLEERWLHHVASQLAPNDRSPSGSKLNAAHVRALIDKHGFPDCLDHLASLCEYQPDRPGNHVSWWTHDKAIAFLKRAGFSTVYRSGYGQSACPVLRNTLYFDNTHPQFSLYVEAIR